MKVLASVLMAVPRAACVLFEVNEFFALRTALADNSPCSPGYLSVQLNVAEARERAQNADNLVEFSLQELQVADLRKNPYQFSSLLYHVFIVPSP